MDVDLDGVAFHFLAPAIQPLLELGARQHLAGPLQQRFEQREFAVRQIDGLAVAGHLMTGLVQRDAEMLDDVFRAAGLAPQHRADAGSQLVEVEGLDDVIVGAGVESLDAIVDRVPGREDQHWHLAAGSPQPLQDLQAIQPGQAEIEQHQFEGLCRQGGLRCDAVLDPVDRQALLAQPKAHRLTDHGVVFYEEQSHGDMVMVPGRVS